MFDTSKDLLNVVIAFSVLLFTVFLVWIMYYIVQILKQANTTLAELHSTMHKMGETLDLIRDKATSMVATISTMGAGMKEVLSFIERRRASSKRKEENVTEEEV
ncbi:MAG: hypothetical protein HYV34_00960 [Candidatus Kerfeldbacteria bacterium]|nr:hypothetical protein [Candidatus Kerfeldbacteria bacterium]